VWCVVAWPKAVKKVQRTVSISTFTFKKMTSLRLVPSASSFGSRRLEAGLRDLKNSSTT
jgi:hypothetical protein